jgi:hypothetical protein
MNLQHLLVARQRANEAGFELTTPVPHEDGFECSLIKNGVAVFTAIRPTDDAAIQACLEDVLAE